MELSGAVSGLEVTPPPTGRAAAAQSGGECMEGFLLLIFDFSFSAEEEAIFFFFFFQQIREVQLDTSGGHNSLVSPPDLVLAGRTGAPSQPSYLPKILSFPFSGETRSPSASSVSLLDFTEPPTPSPTKTGEDLA